VTAAIVAGSLLALGVAVWVLVPLLRSGAGRVESTRQSVSELRELHAQQQMLLASLKDLEDDRATNKLGDDDYAALKERLSAETIDVMRRLDAAQAAHDEETERERRAAEPLRHPAAGRSGGSA
jgi:hypothetical protein